MPPLSGAAANGAPRAEAAPATLGPRRRRPRVANRARQAAPPLLKHTEGGSRRGTLSTTTATSIPVVAAGLQTLDKINAEN